MKAWQLFATALVTCLITCWFLFPLPAAAREAGGAAQAPRFVFIHLDGVSSRLFYNELEKGNLPHLEATFAGHGKIRYAVTYFPPKTKVVMSRIKQSLSNAEGHLVSWGGYDREQEASYTALRTLWDMSGYMSRRALSQGINGLPLASYKAGPSLVNAAGLLDSYDVVDFYWYSTDLYGHFYGKRALKEKLYEFDRYFGELAGRLDDDVNIIIYSDHGMTFAEHVCPEAEMRELLGADFVHYAEPNLFLSAGADRDGIARQLVDETAVAYSFYRAAQEKVVGYHAGGRMAIEGRGEKVRYTYEGEDLFDYYAGGYDGSFLNREKWLELTHDFYYPAAPPNLYSFLQNPHAGDVIVGFEPEYDPEKLGDHESLRSYDMTVPVLLRGPEVAHLYDREYIWLEQLVEEIPALGPKDFAEAEPERESNFLGLNAADGGAAGGPGRMDLSLSPAYRSRLRAEVEREGDRRMWMEYDLFSSYLSRFWAGLGKAHVDGSRYSELVLRYELRLGELKLDYARRTSRADSSSSIRLAYRLSPRWSLDVVELESFGLRLHW